MSGDYLNSKIALMSSTQLLRQSFNKLKLKIRFLNFLQFSLVTYFFIRRNPLSNLAFTSSSKTFLQSVKLVKHTLSVYEICSSTWLRYIQPETICYQELYCNFRSVYKNILQFGLVTKYFTRHDPYSHFT